MKQQLKEMMLIWKFSNCMQNNIERGGETPLSIPRPKNRTMDKDIDGHLYISSFCARYPPILAAMFSAAQKYIDYDTL